MVTKTAQVVNPQQNPNLTIREAWKNHSHASNNTSDKTYAYSYVTKTKYVTKYKTVKSGKTTKKVAQSYGYKYNHPQVISAHDFRLNIPSNATVTKAEFQVRMRVGSGATVEAPKCLFDIYGGAWDKKKENISYNDESGWNNGLYQMNKTTKLATSWKTYKYTLTESIINQGKFKISDWNETVMGIDLQFKDATFKGDKTASARLDLAWVKLVITYEVPKYKITYQDVTSPNKPRLIVTGENYKIKATYTQSTKGKGGTQKIKLDLPWGTDLIGTPSASSGSSFDNSTMLWTVPANGKQTKTLTFTIRPFLGDMSTLTLSNRTVGSYPYHYTANASALL